MGFATRQVTLQAAATNTTQDFTSSGFGTPDCAIIITSLGGTSGSWSGHAALSFGFYDGTNQRCAGMGVQNGGTPGSSDSNVWKRSAEAVYTRYEGGTLQRNAAASFVTDGVRLTWTSGSARPYVTVILLKGLTASLVGHGTPHATQDTSTNITTTGVDPNVILFAGISSATENTNFTQPRIGLGFAVDNGVSIDQGCKGLRFLDSDATDGNSEVADNRCCAFTLSTGGSLLPSVECTAMGTDQFSITTRDAAGSGGFIYLALETTENVDGFSASTPTSAGDWDPFTVSYEPEWVFMIPTAAEALNTAYGGSQAVVEGMGLYSANNSGDEDGHYIVFENGASGAGTTFSSSAHASEFIIADTNSGAQREIIDGNSPTFDGSGIVYADANFNHGATVTKSVGFAIERVTANSLIWRVTHEGIMNNG